MGQEVYLKQGNLKVLLGNLVLQIESIHQGI